MRKVIGALLFLFSVQAFAVNDPNAAFVDNFLGRARDILAQPDPKARQQSLCRLFSQRLGNSIIGDKWLGEFVFLQRELMAVNQFRTMVPSIVYTQLLKNFGDGELHGAVKVHDASTDKGSRYFDVDVEITPTEGETLNAQFVVWARAGRRIVDVVHNGQSAAAALGAEYQRRLKEVYDADPDNSMPVTALMQSIQSEPGFTRCF